MIARRTFLTSIASLALGTLTLGGASAARADDDDPPRRRPMPLAAILARVEGRFQGRALDADIRAGKGGRLVYEVRFLTERGNLLQIQVDAATGDFLDVDGHGFVEALKPAGR